MWSLDVDIVLAHAFLFTVICWGFFSTNGSHCKMTDYADRCLRFVGQTNFNRKKIHSKHWCRVTSIWNETYRDIWLQFAAFNNFFYLNLARNISKKLNRTQIEVLRLIFWQDKWLIWLIEFSKLLYFFTWYF